MMDEIIRKLREISEMRCPMPDLAMGMRDTAEEGWFMAMLEVKRLLIEIDPRVEEANKSERL